MKLIVGLGNPGKEYEGTRHNIGFEVLKILSSKLNLEFKKKFQGLIAEGKIAEERALFLMPQTYMNLSGNSIIEVINFYKIDSKKDLIVIYDDMDLSIGKLRIRQKGSSGGHNGIKSIIAHIGEEFYRIKCGIGKPETKEAVTNYVLSKFSKEQEILVKNMIEKVIYILEELVKGNDIDKIMSKYN